MAWRITDDRPIWIQLYEQLTEQIVAGRYKPGDRMLSVRELAADAGVNPNTMQRALSELEESGLVQTNRTAGRVVTDNKALIARMRKELAEQQIIEFLKKMEQLGFEETEIALGIEEQFRRGRGCRQNEISSHAED